MAQEAPSGVVAACMTTPRKLLLVLCLLALAAPAPASATGGLLRPLDVRHLARVTAPVSAVAARARAALQRTLGVQGIVDIDPLTGTPRTIADLDGFLTGPQAGQPTAIAKRWARSHRTVMGLSPADLSAAHLKLLRDATAPDGSTTMIWAQTYRGIPSLDTTLRATVTRDGRLLTIGGSPLPDLRAPVVPALSARDALQKAIGSTRSVLAAVPRVLSAATGARRTTNFTGGNQARLILVNMGNEVRLGWQVWLDAAPDKVWDVIV